MRQQVKSGVGPEISVIWRRDRTIGACQHLRLTAPFAWLERHEGWPPLQYALGGNLPRRLMRQILGCANRLTSGRAYPRPSPRLELAPSPRAQALLVYREAKPELGDGAYRLARRRGLPVVYDTDDLLLDVPDHLAVAAWYAALRPHLIRWIRQADHVTASTPALAAELAEYNPSVSVLPNFIDIDLWGISEISPPDDGPVTIGFWGGSGHLRDLRPLTPAFRHLKQRYGRGVRFLFCGCCDPELLSLEDVRIGDYVKSYAEYACMTRRCRLDIAIAPLAVHRFNRCKSPIKFFEYSVRGACGVYADLEPYQPVVRHGENGFLIGPDGEEWVGALEQLVEDPGLRYRLARQAQTEVLARHTLDQHAWRWRGAYEAAIERFSLQPAAKEARVPV
jgi:glycosyltransferase involved in cell wall biosynthesis